MKTIRAFIAVKAPSEVTSLLAETAASLQELLPRRTVRWVRPELMHLTLHFLGDTDTNILPAVYAAMDDVTSALSPFNMTLSALGCFPNARRPRVIWAGLDDATGQVASLHGALSEALAPLGWQPERKPFHPHLTLGRVKGNPRDVVGLPWGKRLDPLPVPLTTLYLIESQLRPTGPVYTVRHAAALDPD